MQNNEVLIVGAGPAGLNAAISLKEKRGYSVTIIDKHITDDRDNRLDIKKGGRVEFCLKALQAAGVTEIDKHKSLTGTITIPRAKLPIDKKLETLSKVGSCYLKIKEIQAIYQCYIEKFHPDINIIREVDIKEGRKYFDDKKQKYTYEYLKENKIHKIRYDHIVDASGSSRSAFMEHVKELEKHKGKTLEQIKKEVTHEIPYSNTRHGSMIFKNLNQSVKHDKINGYAGNDIYIHVAKKDKLVLSGAIPKHVTNIEELETFFIKHLKKYYPKGNFIRDLHGQARLDRFPKLIEKADSNSREHLTESYEKLKLKIEDLSKTSEGRAILEQKERENKLNGAIFKCSFNYLKKAAVKLNETNGANLSIWAIGDAAINSFYRYGEGLENSEEHVSILNLHIPNSGTLTSNEHIKSFLRDYDELVFSTNRERGSSFSSLPQISSECSIS
jgi:hypothetical protein